MDERGVMPLVPHSPLGLDVGEIDEDPRCFGVNTEGTGLSKVCDISKTLLDLLSCLSVLTDGVLRSKLTTENADDSFLF